MLSKIHCALVLCTLLFCALFSNAQTTVYSEDFNAGFGGWTAVDVTDATDVWANVGGAMEINGFGGTDDLDWLISPAINMDAQSGEYFFFDYLDNFSGALMELLYSTDYTGGGTVGDVNAATWTSLPLVILDIDNISCHPSILQRHPAIDVSAILGTNVYFAFRYTGLSGTSKDYTIDNVHIEAEYYTGTGSLNCAALKTELYQRIKDTPDLIRYTSSSLYDVWDAYHHTDTRLNDAGTQTIVWDMFTDIPNATGEFEFDHCNNRDNGSCPGGEGQCYNREHTFPRSWWGGGTALSDTINVDLHHLFPSDRSLNSAKSNYPPGEVTTASTTGSNGFLIGTNGAYPCASMSYFEPIDEYKGDYARAMFYIATRYQHQMAAWETINARGDCAMSGDPFLGYETWLIDVLLQWHANDPVSQKEIDRNNAVHAIQGNRNPYIDVPNFVNLIWGDETGAPCNLIPLPITLITFDVQPNGSTVDISWATASEYRNDYFLLQRSTDLDNWKTLTQIPGQMNSEYLLYYSFTDASPVRGWNYYRLCQVDVDGTRHYSDIKSATIGSNLNLYPNPCQNELHLNNNGEFKVFDMMGSDVTNLVEASSHKHEMVLEVSKLSQGQYLIQFEGIMERFTKINQ